MAVELSTAIIISIASLAFSVFVFMRNDRRTDTKDVEERVRDNTRINTKLDDISQTTKDIRAELASMRNDIKAHNDRLIKVEESLKSIHHRVDTLESRLNDKEV